MNDYNKYRYFVMWLFIAGALLIWLVGGIKGCATTHTVERDTIRIESRDTITIQLHDTVPKEVERRKVKYIPVPVKDTVYKDSMPEILMPVVQKKYSDDSTYTAYVSGIEVDDLPKLDSINVKQRIITHTITETITIQPKKKHWKFGIQGGYGITPAGLQPYIGIGLTYTLP